MSDLYAAITSDIDSLEDIYKGQGCTRPGGYTHTEMRIGLEGFDKFLKPYGAKATLFMVGNDFQYEENQGAIRAMAEAGHEIANHTMTHEQGFRLLSPAEKEQELAGMEAWCEKITGRRPVGFRSPGWNMSDDALPILLRRGYCYDSSIFPTSLMPVLKFMHWYTMHSRGRADRTTMGQLKYLFAPPYPYRTGERGFLEKGSNGLIEFPITVTPVLRLPFFATFLVSTGLQLFQASLKSLLALKRPVQFQFHLSDFVDYHLPEFAGQVPQDGMGLYVPQALRLPLDQKAGLFRKVMDALSEDYEFVTLENWSARIEAAK